MEYVFGTDGYNGVETLRTKGNEHTDFEGFVEIVQEFEDSTITDSFRVVRKKKSEKDSEGNCYDWYEIDRHNRIVDKTKRMKRNLDVLVASILEG